MPKTNKSKEETLIDFAKDKGVTVTKNTKFTTKSPKNDPNKPTRARNAYIFFLIERSPIVKASRPDLQKVTDRSAIIADLWKNLTPSEKEVYDKMAQEDKERAKSDMTVYKASLSSAPSSSSSKPKRKRSKTIIIPLAQYTEENLLDF